MLLNGHDVVFVRYKINYDRIDAPLNKTIKGFIDFYIK